MHPISNFTCKWKMKNDDNRLSTISKSIKRYTNWKQSNTNLCEFIFSTRWGLRPSSFLLKIQTLFSFPITNLLSSEKKPTTISILNWPLVTISLDTTLLYSSFSSQHYSCTYTLSSKNGRVYFLTLVCISVCLSVRP